MEKLRYMFWASAMAGPELIEQGHREQGRGSINGPSGSVDVRKKWFGRSLMQDAAGWQQDDGGRGGGGTKADEAAGLY